MRLYLTAFLLISQLLGPALAAGDVTVYKSPSCGCCGKWVQHLRDNGMSVTEVNVDDVSVYKDRYGVPPRLSSCHTAVVDGYVIEGHVPAGDVIRLLTERPEILGLTVPGMPLGSPGMEMGETRHAYEVLAIETDGETRTWNSYPGN